jgi:hypothetical protein
MIHDAYTRLLIGLRKFVGWVGAFSTQHFSRPKCRIAKKHGGYFSSFPSKAFN